MGSIKWLLATKNPGKINELNQILKPFPIELSGLDAMGIRETSPESGTTFLDNAMQKAKFYYDRAGVPVLADDSGLEVDALNGAPGIHSARFGGFPDQRQKCLYLLNLLEGVQAPYRTARFHCAAVYFDGWRYISAEGSLEGFIRESPTGNKGFGYDPIFQPELNGPTLAQFDMAEKNAVSHRGKAFSSLLSAIFKLNEINL